MEPPSAAALSESRIDRFIGEIRKTLSEQDLDFFYRLLARLSQEQEIEMMDIAAALAYLNQRERPLNIKEDPLRPPKRFDGRGESGWDRDAGRRQGGWEDRPPPRERFDDNAGHRDERRLRPERPQPRRDDADLTSYRIEVGHRHSVTPREIVGAIANVSGLEGRYIGRIDIRDDHSVVDLPKGMPNEIFQHLKRVYVRGQALRIAPADEGRATRKGNAWEGHHEGARDREARPPRAGADFPHRDRNGDLRSRPSPGKRSDGVARRGPGAGRKFRD